MKATILLALLALFSPSLFSQEDSIATSFNGMVMDADSGEPVPYATIACPGCYNGGAITNGAGQFEIWPKGYGVAINISHILYEDYALNLTDPAKIVQVKLSPAKIELPLVEVNGSKGLRFLSGALGKLKSTSGIFFKGRGYYRQTSQVDDRYTSLLESFIDVGLSSEGVMRWEMETGRFAISPGDGWMNIYNFSVYTRKIKTFVEAYEKGRAGYPLNMELQKFYAVDVEKYLKSQNRTIAIINCFPQDGAPEGSYSAKVYVDTTTLDLLEFTILSAGDLELTFDKDKVSTSNEVHEVTYRMKRSSDNSSLVPASISSVITLDAVWLELDKTSSNEVRSTFVVLEEMPTRRLGKDRSDGESDYDLIRKIKYKPRFWRKYPVLKNTPLEVQMIEDFEKNKYFGTASFD
ncbi:peptidase associated/transthyretin-like domain-containing protein [Neolewinella persica]|uniref:hypothetical protein n=1 Tax=Neolewinella persica TaxID=70998 RepID=UPI00038052CA|nr:hypothetical protein [Neolewinella persica]